jgi:UDP-N-acetylmuramoyl-tripeptide--D-alanyl-D-alanine ligase
MIDMLWTPGELAAATQGEIRGSLPGGITGISIDSRTLEDGDAFFSIAGDQHDGHRFAADALAKGAALAVISADKADGLANVSPALIVPDVLRALEDAGRAARARTDAAVIAVTGSVGKTGTKEMLRLALQDQGATHASAASYNNHWGVPLTLARMPRETRFGVFEIGMNHVGEIIPLTKMVRPDVAIITTVEPVHIAHFPSVEAIADAKAEIFFGLKRGGIAVLNRDNAFFERLSNHARASGARVVSFGTDEACDARLVETKPQGQGSQVRAVIEGISLSYRLGAPGRHLVLNSLAALLSAHHAGADVAKAAGALSTFRAPKGRGHRTTLKTSDGKITLIDESYNANPASMRAALAVLGQVKIKGRRIAVLGDMLELGGEARSLHLALADAVEADVDLLFAAGENMRALFEATPQERRGRWAATSEDLTAAVLDAVKADDAVMIKGSLGSRMGPIVDALAQRFAASDTTKGDGAGAREQAC